MKNEVRLAQVDIKKPAVTVPVTVQGLWRPVTWGATAATALLIGVLSKPRRRRLGTRRGGGGHGEHRGRDAGADYAKLATSRRARRNEAAFRRRDRTRG